MVEPLLNQWHRFLLQQVGMQEQLKARERNVQLNTSYEQASIPGVSRRL